MDVVEIEEGRKFEAEEVDAVSGRGIPDPLGVTDGEEVVDCLSSMSSASSKMLKRTSSSKMGC